ncbi:ubiquitin thioesterase OTUB2 [Takifugu rubripes]|uniref:ubiquitinyl hydrolase 1 n=2 Tax=Takifugu TaxID=31032 RepID=A0A674MBN3_TAKRU|nr:ubiquitin thioesterase OTUB2 [Takifugu rubripes]XP_056914151.1 ubiquitin thioesterase OTUB2-like [Takifugu flavidus]TWW72116.1 Ubiquitin thioesterase OTUB2 [Takifugu flavidus]|eukprot:XP_003962514.1 PREDICTED: ubiquitin thioesterase OTUB2 [Takifugu rubripes]
MEAATLVSCKDDISSLFPEKTSRPKDKELRCQFPHVRRVQGDGNCLYRALFFAHLESMVHNARALQRFKEKIAQTSKEFFSAGFKESSFMHHLNTVVDVVERCQGEQEDRLLHLFNERTVSDGLVKYLRLLTSAHLQNHADFFSNFVEAPDLRVYCHQEVENMAMEGDHVEILALSQALDISIHIVSMDGEQEHLAHHVIPEGAEPSLHLLHRSSHYSILYPPPQN